jgi:O-antigen ligase
VRIFRIGICALITASVLAFGAVEEWSQALLEIGASGLLFAWAIYASKIKAPHILIPPELPPLCLFGLVGLLQLTIGLTTSWYDTRVQLQLLAAYIIVLFLMSQVYFRPEHWRGFVWFVVLLGFLVSLFGILQYLTFNQKLFWFREMHYGGMPFGPYVNRNHFAGFVELTIPFSLVPLALGKVRRERMPLMALFATVPIVALLLTTSRGGILSFIAQLVFLFSLLLIRKVNTRYVIVGGMVILLAVSAVTWIGAQNVLQRFSGIQRFELSTGKRIAMRKDTWRLFLDHPVIGTGLGSFEKAYPRYDSEYDGKVVNHAHNDYLEGLAETGLIGGACCLWFLVVVFRNAFKNLTNNEQSLTSLLSLSGMLGFVGIVIHSLVDFNLHIPANALLFFVCAHLACLQKPGIQQEQMARSRRRRVRKSPIEHGLPSS